MSRNYDNWERLVAAVLKKEQLWQLFHEQSRSPSLSSESETSSGFSFSFHHLTSDDFTTSEFSASFDQKEEGNDHDYNSTKAVAVAHGFSSNILLPKDQSPVKIVSRTRSRKRDLKIEVPVVNLGVFKHDPDCCRNTSPRMASLSTTPVSRDQPRTNWPPSNDSKQKSYPLPLPPITSSNPSPFTRSPNSAATSPAAQLRSPERVENVKSPVSPWKKGKFLSKGAFGNVYIGFNSETGEMCAMKEVTLFGDAKLNQSAMQLGKQLEKEIALLSSLRHPNLVKYYGSETLAGKFYIYLEYVSGGSIYGILQQYGRLGESAIRSYIRDILSGLAYLHSKSIAHRDIKVANILVDPNGGIKLANFGIAKHIADQSDPLLQPASPYWMAPEVLLNSNVRNRAVDIWCLGWTVLEMATSKPQVGQYDRMVSKFMAGNHKEQLPIIPDHLSDEGKDFVRRCLQCDPAHRATASQLLEHPFVKNVSPSQKLPSPPPLGKHKLEANAGIDHARSFQQLDSGRLLPIRSSTPSNYIQLSDIYTPRTVLSPVSPVGSPLPHPRSPQQLNERISPSRISSLHTTRSSTSTHQIGAIPFHHPNQSILSQEKLPHLPNHHPIIISSPSSYWDPNILRGAQSKLHAYQTLPPHENDSRQKQFGNSTTANEQLVLANRVSKKLLNAP